MVDGKRVRPFGLRDEIGYLFGDFGNSFTFIFVGTFLMIFYMKIPGIPGAAVGTLFLATRIVDAFRDIAMGRIVDVYGPRKDGRFKQWIRRMAGLMAIVSFLMYQSSLAGASTTVKVVHMYVTYLLWDSICYTAVNIPCGSMASAITDKSDERTKLSTFRSTGANLAQLIISILGPVIIYIMDKSGAQVTRNNGHTFPVVAIAFSLCTTVCYAICYRCTTEQVKIDKDPDAPKIALAKTLKTIFSNRAMLGIIGTALFLILSQFLTSGLNNYLYASYSGDIRTFSNYTSINIMLSLVLVAFMDSIIRRMGKEEAVVAATALIGAVYLVPFFLKLTNPWMYMISAAIGFLGVNPFDLVIRANVAGVVDDTEVVTGKREDETICSMYSFTRKAGQVLIGNLSGYTLEMVGHQSTNKVQSPQVLNGSYTISTLVPALLFFCVTIMLLVVYLLNRKKVEKNSLVLRGRRTEK